MRLRLLASMALTVLASFDSMGGVSVRAQSPAFTLDGDIALWTMAIKADKTQDFERVMAKLRGALSKSANPVRRQQLAGWKVMRVKSPLPDGNVAYVHVINPVVAGADYQIMPILYDEFPDERQALYELYRGAFVSNLSLAPGTLTLDMKKAADEGSASTGQ